MDTRIEMMSIITRNSRMPAWGVIVALSIFVCGLSGSGHASEQDTLNIAFIAYQNPEQVVEDVRPVAKYLENELDMKVKYFVVSNYAAIVEALKNESADVGFMGPLQYVIAHDQAGAEPILGEVYSGKPTYVSKVFVRRDSGIESLEDLKGKNIAFVDPISSSGYLYPLKLFKAKGLIKDKAEDYFGRVYFAGGDEQAIRAVLNKFVDAAAVGQYSYSLLRPSERDEVVAIADSAQIPSHCVVVREGLDVSVKTGLQNALLALNEGPNKGLLKYLYNVDGYVKVSHEDYAGVVDVAKEFGFLK